VAGIRDWWSAEQAVRLAAREAVHQFYSCYPELTYADGTKPAFPDLAASMARLREVLR
jgi:hypothetical protein